METEEQEDRNKSRQMTAKKNPNGFADTIKRKNLGATQNFNE